MSHAKAKFYQEKLDLRQLHAAALRLAFTLVLTGKYDKTFAGGDWNVEGKTPRTARPNWEPGPMTVSTPVNDPTLPMVAIPQRGDRHSKVKVYMQLVGREFVPTHFEVEFVGEPAETLVSPKINV